MRNTIMNILMVFCILVIFMSMAAQLMIYFVPVPGEHSNAGVDWYILCHYWYIHTTLIVGVIGYALISTIQVNSKRNKLIEKFLERMAEKDTTGDKDNGQG